MRLVLAGEITDLVSDAFLLGFSRKFDLHQPNANRVLRVASSNDCDRTGFPLDQDERNQIAAGPDGLGHNLRRRASHRKPFHSA